MVYQSGPSILSKKTLLIQTVLWFRQGLTFLTCLRLLDIYAQPDPSRPSAVRDSAWNFRFYSKLTTFCGASATGVWTHIMANHWCYLWKWWCHHVSSGSPIYLGFLNQGYPQFSSMLHINMYYVFFNIYTYIYIIEIRFSMINHPAIRLSPFQETPNFAKTETHARMVLAEWTYRKPWTGCCMCLAVSQFRKVVHQWSMKMRVSILMLVYQRV